jgi:hypothetical protein
MNSSSNSTTTSSTRPSSSNRPSSSRLDSHQAAVPLRHMQTRRTSSSSSSSSKRVDSGSVAARMRHAQMCRTSSSNSSSSMWSVSLPVGRALLKPLQLRLPLGASGTTWPSSRLQRWRCGYLRNASISAAWMRMGSAPPCINGAHLKGTALPVCSLRMAMAICLLARRVCV